MTDLIAELQRQIDRKSDLRLLDAVATGTNTVLVGQSTVAVTLPAWRSVFAGEFCQVLEQGAGRVIVGPVGREEADTYVATVNNGGTGNLTHDAHWTREGRKVRVAWSKNFTGTGTAGTLSISLPFNFGGNSGAFEVVGNGYWYDVSTGGPHIPLTVRRSGTAHAVEFVYDGSGAALLGSAVQNGDAVGCVFTYEWA